MNSHKYEFALLRANGLIRLEVLRLIIDRMIIQFVSLITISGLLGIGFNYLFYHMGYTKEIHWTQGLTLLIPLGLLVILIGNVISIATILWSSPSQVLKNN